MNILLAGSSGQLGQELLPLLEPLGKVTMVDRASIPGARATLQQELGDLNRVEILLNRMRPYVVVNAAAYTAVDQAEDDTDTAFRINADLPGCLARWSARNNRLMVHYSTDYVFSGNASRPYVEDDVTGPLGVYGESKLAGEVAITSAACRHVILRTSWVYSSLGNNFLLTMLRLARERPSLSIVSDQVGCPTWARNLAGVTQNVIQQLVSSQGGAGPNGIYHYCDGGVVSWYEFACAIFAAGKQAGLLEKLPETTAIVSANFPQKARRPLYSVLNTAKIHEDFGIEQASLAQALQSCLEEMANNEQ